VRVSDLAVGSWSPIRLRPFTDRSEGATMPYVWASDSTFVVEKLAYTWWAKHLPFESGPSPAGYYLCGVDNAPCRPIGLLGDLETPIPMARHGT
jgi:hypothetical protein